MSVLTIADLRRKSNRHPGDLCWHWTGASCNGSPRIWTFDHDLCDKRLMSGAGAVWNIARQAPLHGRIPFRGCMHRDCVNPAHITAADSKAEMWARIALSGRLKGNSTVQRRANMVLAQQACGATPTPDAIVLAIRAAVGTGRAIAAQFGIGDRTVSRIRRGESHRHLLPVSEAA